MAASAAALLAPVRRLIALNVAPLLAALTAMLWLRAAVASCACRLSLRRCRCPAMLCLYTDCRGGYHSDLRAAWSSLERTVQSGAPGIKWCQLRRFTMFFDDQVNYPAESCRASLGYFLACSDEGAGDQQGLAAELEAWSAHLLVSAHGLQLAIFPPGTCLAADLPHCGPLSYLICLLRALHCFRREARAVGVHSQVPGLRELCNPAQRRISFLLPLEGRSALLPF